ncbi:MAG: hypothetical protein AAB521_04095 [Patescibacteria group bacterium]
MKKFLPNFKIFFLSFIFLFFLLLNFSPLFVNSAFAADPPASVPDGTWIRDPDVTFAGKSAARSGKFLDWAIANYQWSSVSGTSGNPLASFWQTIEIIVLAFSVLFVLVTAFVIIVTRGKNITIMRFIPRFIMIILLIVLSFSIVQFLYQINDAIQGFFFKNTAGAVISQKDLLFVGFDYKNFLGYRVSGMEFDESAFVSLLLVKLTALTYYVMVGVLLLRKIILWFFIVISPVFPLLLFYSPIRNTAKIWIGEFFRWLLYAPLFAIFLSGLVRIWSSPAGIPLPFNFNKPEEYKTSISILLGGPGQTVNLSNSVNNSDTFALYVVALLMLWVVIILPFLLLQIFLDFIHEFSFSESNMIKQMIAGGSSIIGRGPNGKPPPPPSTQPLGSAKPLPFFPAKIAIPEIRANEAVINAGAAISQGARVHSEILNLTNLTIPTMRDVATYETSLLSSNIQSHQEIARVHETLEGIADPRRVSVSTQREKFTNINEKLTQSAQRGDPLAASILTAASSVVSKTSVIDTARLSKVFTDMKNLEHVSSFTERQRLTEVKKTLSDAAQRGDPLATSILSVVNKEKIQAGKVDVDENLKIQLAQAKEKGSQVALSVLEAAGISEVKLAGANAFSDQTSITQTSQLSKVLTDVNNIDNITSAEEKQKLTTIKTALSEAADKGDPLATSILSVMHKETAHEGKAEIDDNLKIQLAQAKEKGSQVALSVLEAAGISDVKLAKQEAFPQSNRVQSVNVEDYESVKKIWLENYKKLDPPKTIDGKQRNRKEWALNDIDKISETISFLASTEPQNVTKGMERVGTILPFLLIGGFSQTEVVTYLKAKLEAAKSVVSDLDKAQNEEDTMLGRETKKEGAPKEMEAQEELKDELPEEGKTEDKKTRPEDKN